MSRWLSSSSNNSTSLVARYLRRSLSSTAAPALSSLSNPPQEKEKGTGWTRFLLFVPGAITFGLGTWQIFRRNDKINMLEYRKSKLGSEPINCNNITFSKENLDALEFRRLVCEGVFDEKKSIYVGPRSRSISGVTENGYYVITPLMPIPNNPKRCWIAATMGRDDGNMRYNTNLVSELQILVVDEHHRTSSC